MRSLHPCRLLRTSTPGVGISCHGLSRLILFGLLWAAPHLSTNAQDDPFGSSDPFGEDSPSDPDLSAQDATAFGSSQPDAVRSEAAAPRPTAGSKSDPLDRNLDPLILILRENPPNTPKEFGRALQWMTSLGHWSEVAGLLDQVASRNWNLQNQAEVARTAGASTWIRLRDEDIPLNPTQRELVNKLLQAPSTLARDRSRVDQRIEQLSHEDPEKRRIAQLRLQDGGSAAIQRLMERLIQGDNKVSDLMLAGTIVEFGPSGVEALQAACAHSDPQVVSRLILALADLPSNHFPLELSAGLHSGSLPAEVQKAIAERLTSRNFRLPTPTATATHLTKALNQALEDYQAKRINPSQLQDIGWRIQPGSSQVIAQDSSRELKSLERLYQIAQHRGLLSQATPEDLVALAAVGFQRSYQLDPDRQNQQWDAAWLSRLPEESLDQPEFWINVFRQADSWQMHGGCVRSLQELTQRMLAGQVSPPMDFLSELLNDPRPIIRYLALEAVAAVDPREGYAGSERALATALEMLQLTNGASSLVIGANPELGMAAESSIEQATGGEATVVSSGREAIWALNQPSPADLIFVVDRVHDMSLFELLQRLGKTQSGGSLPIAVLTDQLYPYEQQYIDQTPGIIGDTLSRDPEAMPRVLQQLLSILDTQPISSVDRQRFRLAADEFLAKISHDRETYAFYPFDAWHQSLLRLPSNTSKSARTQVLASLGTNPSQMRLVQQVVASGATEIERVKAAKAFAKSVRRFGNLLTVQDVQTTYDWYNRLGPGDPVIAKVMTFVLDTIEAQAGTRPWPAELAD